MKAIKLDAQFIKDTGFEIITENDGGIVLVFPKANYLVLDNYQNTIQHISFSNDTDDIDPVKLMLCDEIQFISYLKNIDNLLGSKEVIL